MRGILLFALFASLAILAALGPHGLQPAQAQPLRDARAPLLAGTWYPKDPDTLRFMIEKLLAEADPPPFNGQLKGLIAPHAGYAYSGAIAALGYKLARNQTFDTVVVIAPSHKAAFPGVSINEQGGYATPLGVMKTDALFIEALKQADPRIRYVPRAHAQEHSVEIQVPFLQVVQPEARLVPIVMGNQDQATSRDLAAALVKAARANPRKSVLLIASSDQSHFHVRTMARALDGVVADHVRQFDPQGLAEDLANHKCEACGGGPMVTVMLAAKALGANRSVILGYGDSGDVTGDDENVVGYLSAALVESGQDAQSGNSGHSAKPGEFSPAERELLHAIAREAVLSRLESRAFRSPGEPTPLMKETRGAFVTLTKDGRLRGCIGNLVGVMPLHRTVENMAASAAFSDPRFEPVNKAEFPELQFEISVLTPLKRVSDPKEVQVGTHGVLIRRGGRSGTLLPQVAGEWGWNREELLDNTCRKAGLPKDCWTDPETEIYVYSAEVF